MSSRSPALPSPFTFRRKSSSTSDVPSSPWQSWYRDSASRSPMSSPPPSSSPPPISPCSSKHHTYAHIAASPHLPADLNLRSSTDIIDDMSMVWGPDYRWNSSIKLPTAHCRLPSFRSSFPSDEELPYISDCEMSEDSNYVRSRHLPKPNLPPTAGSVFDSDSEDDAQDDDGYEFSPPNVRSTCFSTSAERGRWASDPIPRSWRRSSGLVRASSDSQVIPIKSSTSEAGCEKDEKSVGDGQANVQNASGTQPAPSDAPANGAPPPPESLRPCTPTIAPHEQSPDASPPPCSPHATSSSSSSGASVKSLLQLLSTDLPSPTLPPTLHDANDEVRPQGGTTSATIQPSDDHADLSEQWSQDPGISCGISPYLCDDTIPPPTTAQEHPPTNALSEHPLQLIIPTAAHPTSSDDLDDSLSMISSLSPVSSRYSSPLSPLHSDEEDDGKVPSLPIPDIDMLDGSVSVVENSLDPSTTSSKSASSSVTLDADKENRRGDKAPSSSKPQRLKKSSEPRVRELSQAGNVADESRPKEPRKAKRKPKPSTSEDGPARKKSKLSVAPFEPSAGPSKEGPKKPAKDKASNGRTKSIDARSTPQDAPSDSRKTKQAEGTSDAVSSGKQTARRQKQAKPSRHDRNDMAISSKSDAPEPSAQRPSKSKGKSSIQDPSPVSSALSSLPDSPLPAKKPLDPQTVALDAEICGMIIECLALSRASSQAFSTLYKSVMQTRPALKAQRGDEEWMEVFHRVLSSGDEAEGGSGIFGKVESSGKDDADRPLEAKWFYVPEKDEDQERATLIRSMMPRPGKRSVTKQYKQYYYQPLAKISRWDSEDEL